MKPASWDHPKMDHLASLLKQPKATAYGLLARLLDWAEVYAPQGDIGRYDNGTIAKALSWGDAERLISALVESRWLDSAPQPFRLVLHDVTDHAGNRWRQKLERQRLTFWNGQPARCGSAGRPKSLDLDEASCEAPKESPQNLHGISTQIALPIPNPPSPPLLRHPPPPGAAPPNAMAVRLCPCAAENGVLRAGGGAGGSGGLGGGAGGPMAGVFQQAHASLLASSLQAARNRSGHPPPAETVLTVLVNYGVILKNAQILAADSRLTLETVRHEWQSSAGGARDHPRVFVANLKKRGYGLWPNRK